MYAMIFQVSSENQVSLHLLYKSVSFSDIGKFDNFTHNLLVNVLYF